MIIKSRSIKADHARNTLCYVDKEEKDHLFLAADGIDISSVQTMMEDFSLYKSNRVKNAFITTVISPSVDDKLDQKGFEKLLKKVLEELKLDNRQFYAVIHQNTETPHIHLVSNRIDFDGKTWNDHHVAWKCQAACENICMELGLTSAKERKGKYQGKRKEEKSEYHIARNKALQEVKKHFQNIKFKTLSIDHIFDHLRSKGVDVEIHKFKNGLFGASFEYQGSKFKASEVSRLLSVVPNEDSYTANEKMQAIIDNNIARFEGRRGQNEIIADMKNQSENISLLSAELKAFSIFMSDSLYQSNMQKREEEKQKYLSMKYGKTVYQIGFKTYF
jgi:hypothetical protein